MDLKRNLQMDIKTIQENYNNYMEAIKKTIEKHAPITTRAETKETKTLGLINKA